jgi:hypothetical protein
LGLFGLNWFGRRTIIFPHGALVSSRRRGEVRSVANQTYQSDPDICRWADARLPFI